RWVEVFLESGRGAFFNGRIGDQQNSPGAVVIDRVAADDVVAAARNHHTAADRAVTGDAGRGHVRVVVVVNRVFGEQPAVVRAGGPGFPVRAHAVLRRWRIIVVLAVAHEAGLVVVELGVLDREVPARV